MQKEEAVRTSRTANLSTLKRVRSAIKPNWTRQQVSVHGMGYHYARLICISCHVDPAKCSLHGARNESPCRK
jgi:hypothetical protein